MSRFDPVKSNDMHGSTDLGGLSEKNNGVHHASVGSPDGAGYEGRPGGTGYDAEKGIDEDKTVGVPRVVGTAVILVDQPSESNRSDF